MFRFDGEVFLLGTAIAAPLKSIKIATICASSQRVGPVGGGRIVANAAPIADSAAVASQTANGKRSAGRSDAGINAAD
jgi:hypothetical protein